MLTLIMCTGQWSLVDHPMLASHLLHKFYVDQMVLVFDLKRCLSYQKQTWSSSLEILIIALTEYLMMKPGISSLKDALTGSERGISSGQRWRVGEYFRECVKLLSDFLLLTSLKDINLV
uniref:Uncharacterized protein n=1 Tax=Opuntia streptacantha TaxID=393608 RepID=A0A7C9B4P1_OPUST